MGSLNDISQVHKKATTKFTNWVQVGNPFVTSGQETCFSEWIYTGIG